MIMEEKMTITINNGFGWTVSAEMDADINIHECMRTVARLLYSAGFALSSIKEGMEAEAEKLYGEFKSYAE